MNRFTRYLPTVIVAGFSLIKVAFAQAPAIRQTPPRNESNSVLERRLAELRAAQTQKEPGKTPSSPTQKGTLPPNSISNNPQSKLQPSNGQPNAPLPRPTPPTLPDLVVEKVVANADKNRVTVVVKNTGTGKAENIQVKAQVFASGVITSPAVATRTVLSLEAGTSQQLDFNIDIRKVQEQSSGATLTAQVEVDNLRTVAERNETNNTLSVPVVVAQADLTVSEIRFDEPNNKVKLEIKNAGTATAKNFQLQVQAVIIGTVNTVMVELKNSIDEIKAGNVKQLELLLDFNSLRQQAGNKPLAIIANADLGNAVAESIEINNKLTQPIPAGLLADLKVKEIQVKEDLKQVRVNVRNFGEAKASEFNLRLQLLRGQTGSLQGVVQDGTKVVGSLEAGSSTDVVFDIDVAAAKQQSSSLPLVLRATADPQNVVPEKDEKNNGFEQIVTQVAVLPELPDLTISSMKTFFNENTVKAVVKNTGNTNAPIAKNIKVSVQFVALPGTEAETILTKTEVLVNQLPSGESTTQAIFADFAAAQQKFKDFIGTGSGKFILRVVVDADNTISEKNESNNRSEEVDITPL